MIVRIKRKNLSGLLLWKSVEIMPAARIICTYANPQGSSRLKPYTCAVALLKMAKQRRPKQPIPQYIFYCFKSPSPTHTHTSKPLHKPWSVFMSILRQTHLLAMFDYSSTQQLVLLHKHNPSISSKP